jgi:DNA-binding MarR family transcriptional regulator
MTGNVGRVSTYICGSGGNYDEYNPSKVTGQEHVPEILYLLNREPLTVEELSRALNVSTTIISKLIQDLARINAIVERNGKWARSIPYFC